MLLSKAQAAANKKKRLEQQKNIAKETSSQINTSFGKPLGYNAQPTKQPYNFMNPPAQGITLSEMANKAQEADRAKIEEYKKPTWGTAPLSAAISLVNKDAGQAVFNAGNRAQNWLGLGFKDFIDSKLNPQTYRAEKELSEERPISSMIGNIAGSIMPGSLIERAGVKLLPSIFKTVEGAKPIGALTQGVARGIIGGGGVGAAEGLTEGLTENKGVLGTLGNAATKAKDYALLGGAATGAIGGTIRGLPKLKDLFIGEDVLKIKMPNVPSGRYTPPMTAQNLADLDAFTQKPLLLKSGNAIDVPPNGFGAQSPITAQGQRLLPSADKPLLLKQGVFEQPPAKPVGLGEAPQGRFAVKGDVKKTQRPTQEEFLNADKTYTKLVEDSKKAAQARMDLGIGATRARVTTANARWGRIAEARDIREKQLIKKYEELYPDENIQQPKSAKISDLTPAKKTLEPIGKYTQQMKQINAKTEPNFKRETPFKAFPGEVANATTPPKVLPQFAKEVFDVPKKPIPLKQNKALKPTKVESNIQTPSTKIEPLNGKINATDGKYPKAVQDKLDSLDAELQYQKEFAKRNYKYADDQGRHIKGQSMKISAEKKKIIAEYEKSAGANMKEEYSKPLTPPTVAKNAPVQPKVRTIPEGSKVKESAVKTNTMVNKIKELQTPEGQKFAKEFEATYGEKPDNISIERANKMLNDDYNGTYDRIVKDGIKSKEDNLAAWQMTRDLLANKNFDEASRLISKVRPDVTNAAQIVQSMETVSKDSLEGIALRAQRLVDSIEADIVKANPNIAETIKAINESVKNNLKLVPVNLQLFAEAVDKDLKRIMGKLYKKDYINSIMDVVRVGATPDKKLASAIRSGYATPELSEATLNKIANAVKQKFGIPTFDGQDLKKMSNLYDGLKGLKPEDWEYRKTMFQIHDVIKGKIPKTMADKWAAYQFINLYGNSLTPLKIKFGNLTGAGMTYFKDILKHTIDMAIPGKTKTTMPSLKTQLKGFKKGAKEVWKDYRNEVDTDPFMQSYDFDTTKGLIFKNKPMREVEKFVKFMLGIMERPYKQGIYDDELRMLMSGAKEPTEEMIMAAREKAQKVMFANDSVGTKLGATARRGINWATNTGINKMLPEKYQIKDLERFGVGNLVQPIIKTPINMVQIAAEYSPLNLLSMIPKSGRSREQVVDKLAKVIIGTVFNIGSGYFGKKTGIISGGLPSDADARNFGEEAGRQPYAINVPKGVPLVGGKSLDVSFFQPLGMQQSFGAELASDHKDKSPLTAAMDSLLEQGMLQGFAKLLGKASIGRGSLSENVVDAITGGATTLVPFGGAVNQISKSIDPYKRDTADDNIFTKNLINRTAQRTPARLLLPKKVTNTGEYVKEDSAANIWLNPGKVKELKNDPVTNEIMRLYDEAGETRQFPPKVRDEITFKASKNAKSQKQELTPQQVEQFQLSLGKSNMEAIAKEINKPEYKRANDKEKAEMLSKAMSANKQRVETEQLKQQGIKEYKAPKKLSKPTLPKRASN